MRLERLVVRGFRNLVELDRAIPRSGVVMLGRNGQGKTNLLEAIYYPVLFRSLRAAADSEVAAFGGIGFHVGAELAGPDPHELAASWQPVGRRKRISIDGAEVTRLADAIGRWIAVAFLPTDVGLAAGPASERRHYLDRMLALSDRGYLLALTRYRAALAQRNSALRQGRGELARAFDGPLVTAGARVVRTRLAWLEAAAPQFARELEELGETRAGTLRYRGHAELAEAGAWAAALDTAWTRDRSRCLTTIGPHRDDLVLDVGGRELRSFGSTGQQRSSAIALKLIEIDTLAGACGVQPALLLDDVFAELDRERQRRLAVRLVRPDIRQVFITAPRPDELPDSVDLPVWRVESGIVEGAA